MVSRQLAVGIAVGVSVAFVMTTMMQLHSTTPVKSVHLQRDALLHAKLDNAIKNLTAGKKLAELSEKLRLETLHHDEEVNKNEELLKKQRELVKEMEALEDLLKEKSLTETAGEKEILQKLAGIEETSPQTENETMADQMKKKVRVLVWVMTQPKNLRNQAKAVRDTWGKRANKLVFFSSKTNKEFPTIGLDVKEGRNHLTAKTMQAFKYVYENYFDDYDWFMKADDDTFVIMENLRFFLSAYNTSDPLYFGHLFHTHVKQGYYSGGAGYVLSKEALRRLWENQKRCRQDGGPEDLNIGMCMQKLGVPTSNTTDPKRGSRFHSLPPDIFLTGEFWDWFYRFDPSYKNRSGPNTISDYAISFHYVPPKDMYKMDLFLYKIRTYGVRNIDDNSLNVPQENRLLKPDQNLDYHRTGCVNRHNCQKILESGEPWP